MKNKQKTKHGTPVDGYKSKTVRSNQANNSENNVRYFSNAQIKKLKKIGIMEQILEMKDR